MARIFTGTYIGNATDNRNVVADCPFQPDCVIILKLGGGGNTGWIWKPSQLAGDASMSMNDGIISGVDYTNGIQAIQATGFQIGSATDVNANGQTYHFICLEADGTGSWKTGSYVGTGADITVEAGIGARFALVQAAVGSLWAGFAWEAQAADSGFSWAVLGAARNDIVTNVDTIAGVTFKAANYSVLGRTYYYLIFMNGSYANVGSYIGDGADNRDIVTTDIGIPTIFFLRRITQVGAGPPSQVIRQATMTGDASYSYTTGISTNMIQSVAAGTFQVGTSFQVNSNNDTFYYLQVSGTATALTTTPTPAGTGNKGSQLYPSLGTGSPGSYEFHKTVRKAMRQFNNLSLGD
jgi:hypothetical protein